MTPRTADPIVVVTGANGLVGSHVVAALAERGATVRAVVRRVGTAPSAPGVEEHVGDFADPAFADSVVAGTDALVTTVHPLGSGAEDQRRVGLDGTLVIAEAAVAAAVPLLVHVSTAGVYDRSPGVGDIDEEGALVPDGSAAYGVVKRDTDAALERLAGITRVLLRPPAILGPGGSSVWNVIRPRDIAADASQQHAVADATFAWVHVDDLADAAVFLMRHYDDEMWINVGVGEDVTIAELAEMIKEIVGFQGRIVYDTSKPDGTPRKLLDVSRLFSLGWRPRIPLRQGLEQTYRWFVEHVGTGIRV